MPRGRPRDFDLDEALDRALEVFWRRGYEGASLPELTEAMGINRPSLYAAFGNKQALFRRAIERYVEGPASYFRDALCEPTARKAVARLLRGTVELLTDARSPPGCFLVQGALACGDVADPLRREMARRREAGVEALRKRLERAVEEGDLPPGADPAALARFVAVVVHGMAVQAAGGAGRGELSEVAEMAMRAWPE
jgi:AcrR family transcriptional regulator